MPFRVRRARAAARSWAMTTATSGADPPGETFQSNGRMMLFPKRQLARVQDEIDQLEGRLRVLLGGS
jgi:hypothetical protein